MSDTDQIIYALGKIKDRLDWVIVLLVCIALGTCN